MAERDRIPNKERRRLAREERKRAEEEAARQARRGRVRSGLISALVVVLVTTLAVVALTGGDEGLTEPVVLDRSEVDAARSEAGCEVINDTPSATPPVHFEAASAPSADDLYPGNRPMDSGPHFQQTLPIVRSGADNQLEERALGHNLEHGSIVAWYDPEQVERDTVATMEDWSARLFESGFANPRGAVGIFVSPYTDPGISSGKGMAFRAWGYSLDCDEWDETVANSVVLERFGSNGVAPEGRMAPFPSDVMRYEDDEADGGASTTPTAPPASPGSEATVRPTPTEEVGEETSP
jgi:hypothetical protein